MKYKSFGITGQKFPKIWNTVQENDNELETVEKVNIVEVPVASLKRNGRFALDTSPNYYNLYNFKGTTYISGASNTNIPSSKYYLESPPGTWTFKLPIYNYRVPVGTTAEDYSGIENWELASSIGNIKSILRFGTLAENDIYSFDLLSYLYDQEGNVVESENFSQFYKWVKNNSGYDFHYYAYWDIPDNKEILLKAELVVMNKKDYGSIQSNKVKKV